MSRRAARRHAFNLVFQLSFNEDLGIEAAFNEYFDNFASNDDGSEREFVYQEFSGTRQNLEKIDAAIKENLKGWTLERLGKTDIAILRLAIYEILFMENIPHSVSINEAVELAKAFSTDESPSFINGMLGSIVKSLEGK